MKAVKKGKRKAQRDVVALDYNKIMSATGPDGAVNLSKAKIPTRFAAAPSDNLGRVIPLEGAVGEKIGPRCADGKPFMDFG